MPGVKHIWIYSACCSELACCVQVLLRMSWWTFLKGKEHYPELHPELTQRKMCGQNTPAVNGWKREKRDRLCTPQLWRYGQNIDCNWRVSLKKTQLLRVAGTLSFPVCIIQIENAVLLDIKILSIINIIKC